MTTNHPPTTMPASPNHSSTSLSDDDVDIEDEYNDLTPLFKPHVVPRWSLTATPITSSQFQHLQQETITLAPAARLPPEILIHTLRHLTSTRDLHACVLVSRTWCECSVELLWHKPHFTKLPNLFKMIQVLGRELPDQTFSYATFVKRLNFVTLAAELSDALFSRLAACTRLERLTLVNCGGITDDALSRVLPSCSSLVALDLTNVSETTDESILILANTAKKLQGINLGGCKKVSDRGVSAIALSCPLLRRIKLSGVEQVTDHAVSLLASRCPLLLEIDLNNCPRITEASVRELWKISTHMRELRLSHCIELRDEAFPAPSSTALDVSLIEAFPPSNAGSTVPNGDHDVQTTSFHSLSILPPLQLSHPSEHLRMLDLTACARVTDTAIEGIISSAPKIRNLVLAKCSLLTDRAVESICKLGKHLHYLHLGHANKITDRAVRMLALHCSRLRYIDLACCTLLTDLSVFELANLPKLRRIGLVRVANLTDDGVVALVQRYNTLERIHLSYCENITLRAVHILLSKLGRLTHLSLTGIPAFRRTELQKFCRSPPREFNTAQRAAFCVYSGTGITQLRRYLDGIMMVHKSGDAHGSVNGGNGDVNGNGHMDVGAESSPDEGDGEGTVIGSTPRGRVREQARAVGEGTQSTTRSVRFASTTRRSSSPEVVVNGAGSSSRNTISVNGIRRGLAVGGGEVGGSLSAIPNHRGRNAVPVSAFDEPVYARSRSPVLEDDLEIVDRVSSSESWNRVGSSPDLLTNRARRRTLRSTLSDASAILFGRNGSHSRTD